MPGFNFWNRWILTVSFLIIVFGLVLILFNQTSIFNYLFNNQVNSVFWGNVPITAPTIIFQQWIYSTLGAVLVGWGIFLTFIVTHAFRNKERWAWHCIVLGITLWFIADTSVSLFYHVYINVYVNVVLFIVLGLPLCFTKKYFK